MAAGPPTGSTSPSQTPTTTPCASSSPCDPGAAAAPLALVGGDSAQQRLGGELGVAVYAGRDDNEERRQRGADRQGEARAHWEGDTRQGLRGGWLCFSGGYCFEGERW